jgi:WD40 repeat protein
VTEAGETKEPSDSFQFDAFISYSHAVDGRLAPALRSSLHKFARPWYRLRAIRVFQDNANLAANPDLWTSIQEALASSRFFLLFASPASAGSPWVAREVDYWLRERPVNRLILMLTDGNLEWDSERQDFAWDRTTALNMESFRYKLSAEPLWLDLRPVRDQEQLSSRDPLFQDIVATTASAIRGEPKDSLLGEDVRHWRRLRRFVVYALLILSVATLTSVSLGVIATRARNDAVREAKVALSRQLAAQAQSQRDIQPGASLMLGVEALHTSDTPEAHAALIDTITTTHFAKLLNGHSAEIKSARFSNDPGLLATASGDGSVIVWQVAGPTERKRVATLTGLDQALPSVAFSNRRSLMAAKLGIGEAGVWDVKAPDTPVLLAQVNTDTEFWDGLEFSPDGKILLIRGDGTTLFDVSDPRQPRFMTHMPEGSRDAAFSPDGSLLATADEPGESALWDVRDPWHPQRIVAIPEVADALAFSPDGSILAMIRKDAATALWRVGKQPELVAELEQSNNNPAFDVDFSPDGTRLATANYDGTTSVWDIGELSSPVETLVLRGHTDAAYSIDFSPDGRSIVSGSADGTAIIWEVARSANIEPLAQIQGYEGAPETLIFTPDSRQVLIASDVDAATLWNVSRPEQPVEESVVLPAGIYDGNADATGNRLLMRRENAMVLWDMTQFDRPKELAMFEADDGWLSPDGETVATFSLQNNTIYLWESSDAEDFTEASELHGNYVAYNPISDIMAITDDESRTGLFRVEDGSKPVREGEVEGQMPTFGNARVLATVASDQAAVLLWDVRDPANPRKLAAVPKAVDTVEITFSPDGAIMAVGSANGVPELWYVGDPSRPISIGMLIGHKGSAYGVTFSPDGQLLATGSYDRSVMFWRLPVAPDLLADPVATACAIAGPGLSRADWNQYLPDETYRQTCRD